MAATELFSLSARLILDKGKFDRDAEKAERQGRKLGDSLKKNLGDTGKAVTKGLVSVAKASAAGIAAASAAVVSFAVKAMGAAGELEQQIGGSEAVWGEYAKRMQEQGEEAYKNLGLSMSEYLANANKMGSLLQGSGFTGGEAVELTTKAMQRAADVASIMGISVEDAMQAINGAAKGNFTMMDNLGVAINDTAIKAYAMQKGWNKQAVKNLTQQQKIQLAFEMFFENTEYAAGNYAKENDTLAGSLTTLKAAFTNLMSGTGGPEQVVEALDMALNAITNTFDKLAPKVLNALQGIVGMVADRLPGLLQTVLPSLISGVQTLLEGLKTTLPVLLEALVAALPELINGVTELIPSLLNALGAALTVVIHQLPEILSSVLTGAANGVIEIINGVFGTNLPHIEDIKLPSWDEISEKVKTWWNGENGIKSYLITVCNWWLAVFGWVGSEDESGPTPEEIVGEWWAGVKADVQAVCDWVLKLFREPAEAWKDVKNFVGAWWTKVRGGAQSALEWVLGIFQNPKEKWEDVKKTVGRWWRGVKSAAGAACDWVLRIFGIPKEDADAVKAKIGGWWATVEKGAADACEWVLKLFSNPVETVQQVADKVSAWWNGENGPRQKVSDACDWILKLFNEPEATAEEAANAVADWWDTKGLPGILSATDWVLKLFGWPRESRDQIKNNIRAWWGSKALPAIKDATKWVLQLFTNPVESIQQVETALGDWWNNTALPAIAKATTWVLQLFGLVSEEDSEGNTVEGIVGKWWSRVKQTVVNACSWALGWFTEPEEGEGGDLKGKIRAILSVWWGKATEAIAEVCSWVLSWFGAPKELTKENLMRILGNWWNSTKNLIATTLKWVIGLFTGVSDKSADGKTFGDIIGTWWEGEKKVLYDTCTFVLGLFGLPDPAEMAKRIINWWQGESGNSGVKGQIRDAMVMPLIQLGGFVANAVKQVRDWWQGENGNGGVKAEIVAFFKLPIIMLGGFIEDAKEQVREWWEGADGNGGVKGAIAEFFKLPVMVLGGFVENAVEEVKTWWQGEDGQGGVKKDINDFLKATFGITLPDWFGEGGVWEQITKWWNDNVTSLKLGVSAFFEGVEGGLSDWWLDVTRRPSSGNTSGGWTGSHFGGKATGLDFVPQNDYLVRTHFGEAILNRQEADEWRNGQGGMQFDYQAMAEAVAAAIVGLHVDMDGRAVGELVAQTVDEQIGVIAHNERYSRG